MSVNAHVNCARVLLIIRVRMALKRPKVDFSPESLGNCRVSSVEVRRSRSRF